MTTQTEDPAACGDECECNSPEHGFISRQICGMTETMREHSGRVTLVSLGAGLVVGYLVGRSLAYRSSRADRHTAEQLGQWIMRRLDHVLPERITSRFRG